MPGVQLPLNIFEPRYLNMVQDALANDHIIGMIQPVRNTDEEAVHLQRVGTAGRITSYNESNDGRIIMVLTGVCRFGVYEEIDSFKGYRRVIADWSRFAGDYDEQIARDFLRSCIIISVRGGWKSPGMILAN